MCPARMVYKESIKARASHTITRYNLQVFFNILIYNVDYMKTEALSHTYLQTSVQTIFFSVIFLGLKLIFFILFYPSIFSYKQVNVGPVLSHGPCHSSILTKEQGDVQFIQSGTLGYSILCL